MFFGVTNYGNKINLLNVNRGSINFILLKYLFAEKRTFKNKYLFTVTSHNPFLFDNENDTCFLGMNNYTFRMERQNQKFTDSDIFMAIKHNNNIAYLNDDSILKLGKHKYYPEQINLINRTIVLQRIKKTAKTIEYPVVIHGLSINSNKTDSFILNKGRKFTLLYFTGSWCIPCKVTLPKILEFDSKYKNLLQIISIHKEKNILEAQKYIAENKIAWLSYYEQLDCMDSDCLDKLYKIQSYPTFLVFDQKGQVILRSNGNNGLSKIEEYFEKIK